jgi:RNA polymerase sigma factor (sigma-70 family)
VRSGDEDAATETVRQYEATVRMAVRVRLNRSDLRRLLDSMDICQSVQGSFFVRVVSGQFELETQGQLVKLLVTMARNKLMNHARNQRVARRDSRRREGSPEEQEVATAGPSPSQVVDYREPLQAVRSRLSEEDRRLADLRGLGFSWAEIAVQLDANADALRFRLSRALDRVAKKPAFRVLRQRAGDTLELTEGHRDSLHAVCPHRPHKRAFCPFSRID